MQIYCWQYGKIEPVVWRSNVNDCLRYVQPKPKGHTNLGYDIVNVNGKIKIVEKVNV